MKNRKGFTLIEIIAVIIILAIIMMIAVPSVTNQIILSRKGSYSTDIKSYMETAEGNYMQKEYGGYLEEGELLLIPISRLELEKGNTKSSPFGNYIQNDSYVIIKKTRTSNEQYINIRDTSGYGVVEKEYEEVNRTIIDNKDTDVIVSLNNYYTCEGGRTELKRGIPYMFKEVEYHACKEEAIIDCTRDTIPIIRMCPEKVCNIIYNLDGGRLSTPNPTVYDDITKNFILNEPTKDGYDFIGWTGSNGDTPQHNVIIGSETSCQKSYKANWQRKIDPITP